jgi:hypothetical protein
MWWSLGTLPLFRNSNISQRGLWALFLLKLLFSLGLVMVYTYYYTDRAYADIYKYFDDGNTIYESIGSHPAAATKIITGIRFDRADPEIKYVLANTHHFDKKEDGFLESNHRLIIRFNAILRFFSYGSIFIHSLFFCFFSFIGLVALYRALQIFFEKDTGRILIIPLFLVPSILFWSSGLLQETLVMLFMGMLFFTAIKVFAMRNILVNLILSLLCLSFLYQSKPFIAMSFLISFYLMGTIYFKGYLKIIAVLIATLGALWFFYAHHTFICEIMSSIVSKRNEFVVLGLKMKAGSLADEAVYSPGCLIPFKLLPIGLYNMFMQPFVWSHGAFEKLFGLENLVVLFFTVLTLIYFQRPKGAKLQLAVFCIAFFLLHYVLIGVTVPIIGALVRYKIFGLLFYLVLLACCIDLNKIISLLNTNKKRSLLMQKAQKFLFKSN